MTLASPNSAVRLDRTASSPRQGGGAPGERLRLRTLVGLRWAAVGGQMLTLLVTRFLLGFDVPLLACLGGITLAALFNLALVLALPPQRVLRQWEAALQLGFDILQLGLLLLLTGGVGNPFTVLLIVPVIFGSSSLEGRHPYVLTGLATGVVLLLAALAEGPACLGWAARPGAAAAVPLGGRPGGDRGHRGGVDLYPPGGIEKSARMELALNVTETVLAREQKLSALGALAASAAHELGTPLATIAVVAKEMAREVPEGPLRDDAELLMTQAQRCRDILRRLGEMPASTDDVVHARISLAQLLEEVVGPENTDDPDDPVRGEWSVVERPGPSHLGTRDGAPTRRPAHPLTR